MGPHIKWWELFKKSRRRILFACRTGDAAENVLDIFVARSLGQSTQLITDQNAGSTFQTIVYVPIENPKLNVSVCSVKIVCKRRQQHVTIIPEASYVQNNFGSWRDYESCSLAAPSIMTFYTRFIE